MTSGAYSLKYFDFKYVVDSESYKRYTAERPFKIRQDITHFNIYFSGPISFDEYCKRIPELKFIKEYTNYNQTAFDMARNNPGFPVPFSFDLDRYQKDGNELITVYITTQEKQDVFDELEPTTYYTYIINEVRSLPQVIAEEEENRRIYECQREMMRKSAQSNNI